MKDTNFLHLLIGALLFCGCTFTPPMPDKEQIKRQIKLEPIIDQFVYGMRIGSALDNYNYELKRTLREQYIKEGILIPDGTMTFSSKLNPKYRDKFLTANDDHATYTYATPHWDDISFISAGPAGYDTSKYMIALVGYHYKMTEWAKELNRYKSSQYNIASRTKTYLLEYNRNLQHWRCVTELNWR